MEKDRGKCSYRPREGNKTAEEIDNSMKPQRNTVVVPRVPEGDGGGKEELHVRLCGGR